MLDELLKVLAPHAQVAQGKNPQPWGCGHGINTEVPHVIKCAGLMGPNPNFAEESAAGYNPPAQILIQHKLGTLKCTEGNDIMFPLRDENGLAISNIPDDAWFTLEPGMTFDPNNPVCPKCGQPFVL